MDIEALIGLVSSIEILNQQIYFLVREELKLLILGSLLETLTSKNRAITMWGLLYICLLKR